MKKILYKYGLYLIPVLVLLVLSGVCKFNLYRAKALEQKNQDIAQVSVWLPSKTSQDTSDLETRKYQVDNFNNENKGKIYLTLKSDFEPGTNDYYNLVKISLASGSKMDMFQYGYSKLFENKDVMSMKDLGIDVDKIGKDNFIYYNKEPMGVKLSGNTVKIAWNKELFKGAGLDPEVGPKTWDDVLKYSEKIKKTYPDVIPFEFPTYLFSDVKISIGEPSVSKGSIYTDFWDYKKGKYDFSYAEDILNVYNQMFKLGYLDTKEFFKKNSNDLRKNFASGKDAMIISTYADKDKFIGVTPLSFEVGISNLPKFNINDKDIYYYGGDSVALMVNKNVAEKDKDGKIIKDSVKKVYEWFLSEKVNKELLATKKTLPTFLPEMTVKNDLYPQYNDKTNFHNEIYSPTSYILLSATETQQLYYDAISGKISVKDAIKQLNDLYEKDCQVTLTQKQFTFDDYTEK